MMPAAQLTSPSPDLPTATGLDRILLSINQSEGLPLIPSFYALSTSLFPMSASIISTNATFKTVRISRELRRFGTYARRKSALNALWSLSFR